MFACDGADDSGEGTGLVLEDQRQHGMALDGIVLLRENIILVFVVGISGNTCLLDGFGDRQCFPAFKKIASFNHLVEKIRKQFFVYNLKQFIIA